MLGQDVVGLLRSLQLNKMRASDLVADYLRTAILRGTIPIGQKLLEEGISKEAGLSRTPVREAIKRLEAEGLVRRCGSRGVEVVGVSPQDYLELFELRTLLEPWAHALAAQRMDERAIGELEKAVSNMEQSLKDNGFEELVEHHLRWTTIIFESCGNKRLGDLLTNYAEYVRRSSMISLKAQGSSLVATHRDITEAIKKHDAELARNLAQRHIDFAYQVGLQLLQVKAR